ncbi:type VI secretion system ImpA family N-terminal domain-containing protein [Microvirga sp. 0TCS3.31]
MAQVDFTALIAPLSEAMPCGRDLDLEEDPEYMNFVAWADGVLPSDYLRADPVDQGRLIPFQREVLNFDDSVRTINQLLTATRDLRILTILAKFAVLNRDLGNFAHSLRAIAELLRQRWDDVHPQAENGDFIARAAAVQTLDDMPTVIHPLQYMPLIPSRRYGFISYRNILLMKGEATAREGEETPDSSAVEVAFREAELSAVLEALNHLMSVKQALTDIRTTWLERAGSNQAVAFPKLAPLADRMITIVEEAVGHRVPETTAPEPPTLQNAKAEEKINGSSVAAPEYSSGSLRTVSDASAALAAVASYFVTSEPSSPALLLVKQAEQLIGKSFREALKTLLPSQADQASIRIGIDQVFELPIERLSEVPPQSTPEPIESSRATGKANGTGEDAPLDGHSFDEHRGEQSTAGAPARDNYNPPLRVYQPHYATITSRQEAITLLQQIGAFYRSSEPASPIPLLTERACSLSQKDFLSLLKDVLPGITETAPDNKP